ncbi:MAG: NnrS family protein [Candidatus Manganitrophaceae bacterium]
MTSTALGSAPHRLLFVGGAFQGIAAILGWLLELSGGLGGFFSSLPLTIPPLWAHAYLMVYGFFPYFIFGFLFTFFPNWLDAERIPPRHYLFSIFALGSGTVLFYIGLIVGKNMLLISILLTLLGWGVGTFSLLRILIPARSPEKIDLSLITLLVIFGAVGLFSFFLWLLMNKPIWLNLARIIGVWFFLLPLVVTVSHLVIPFFSKSLLKNNRLVQPLSILPTLLAGLFIRGLMEAMEMRESVWIPDLFLLFFALYLSSVWGFWKSIEIKMLFMLHLSFAWFSVGLILEILQSLTLVLSQGRVFILGHAPLHALTIGFFASMVIGMSTRVTLGHSGRPIGPNSSAWKIYLIFQIAAITRILADFFPAGDLLNRGGTEGAALLWIGGFSFWLIKYGPFLWRPALIDQ